ncbi:AarF/UbiB family protein [Bdellovibrio sp. HCB2-146]|uniref:AarF/UbiB family protein n=1 Tax=Bdellovibrio sp. HCB2-146 TaxID=3394362 RepID=UPI0039BC30E6
MSYDQRLALSYALVAQGQPQDVQLQYFNKIQNYFVKKFSQKIETRRVRNFNEFLTHFRGEWPNTHSLALDLEIIEKKSVRPFTVYEAPTARVQKKIDNYIHWQILQLKNGAVSSASADTVESVRRFVSGALLLTTATVPQMAKEWLISESDAAFGKQLLKLDNLGGEIANSKIAATQDVKMKILLQTLFSEYFSRLSSDSKKLIVSSYLGRNLRMGDMEKLEILIQNSGPQLQKLLQLVARQGDLPKDVLEVFQKLESSVKEVPWVQVEKLLQAETKNYHFISFERKPLGVGTMAQVHRAKMQVDGVVEDVVVRFIKPGMALRVAEDGRILRELAAVLDANEDFRRTGVPKLSPLVEDVTATVEAELSQQDTINRQNFAKGRYSRSSFVRLTDYKNLLEFHVPSIFPPQGSHSEFMVQEMVFGQKIDKAVRAYGKMAPGIKQSIAEDLARLWLSEVLFGQGFFHADLHMGNFMVQITDPRIRLNILDFGMGGRIDADMQGVMMTLGAGVKLLKADLIARSLWTISDKEKNVLTEQQFYQMLENKVNGMTRETNLPMDGWTAWALDQGLRLPYEFVNLNRGLVIISRLLQESGSTLTPMSIVRDLAAQNPLLVYQRMVVEEKMSHMDILKLGFQEVRDRFSPSERVPSLPSMTCEMLFQ